MAIEFLLNSVNITPPGGFSKVIPQTGFEVKHYDWVAFCNSYRDHHLANGLPLSLEWREELQDALCKQNMPLWHDHCKRAGKYQPRKTPSFGALMSFLNTIQKWIASRIAGEDAFVTKEEATARAAVCVTCPMNSKRISMGCGSCNTQFYRLLKLIVGNRKTVHEDKCGSCGACGCAINAAVWIPAEIQVQGLSDGDRDRFRSVKEFCWKAQAIPDL